MAKKRIKDIECDVAMAGKKGLFPCDNLCRECIAGIKKDENGNREHVDLVRGKQIPRLKGDL